VNAPPSSRGGFDLPAAKKASRAINDETVYRYGIISRVTPGSRGRARSCKNGFAIVPVVPVVRSPFIFY
jgi:hypothetical protein